jgi:hypothetical protein
MTTLMISCRLGYVDGMWVSSLLKDIPFMEFRVVLTQRGLDFHHQRSGPHTYMIKMFGNLVMIWLHIFSTPLRMTCHDILRVMSFHPLIHTLLRMQICFMRNFNCCSHILRNTRTWPRQRNQRFILRS